MVLTHTLRSQVPHRFSALDVSREVRDQRGLADAGLSTYQTCPALSGADFFEQLVKGGELAVTTYQVHAVRLGEGCAARRFRHIWHAATTGSAQADGANEAVTAPMHGFDKTWCVGIIAQELPQLCDELLDLSFFDPSVGP